MTNDIREAGYSAMYKALKDIIDICDGADLGGLDERTAIYNIACNALAIALRNCDIGTLTEQQQRFNDFCEKMQHTDRHVAVDVQQCICEYKAL